MQKVQVVHDVETHPTDTPEDLILGPSLPRYIPPPVVYRAGKRRELPGSTINPRKLGEA